MAMYDYDYMPNPADAEIFISQESVNLTKEHIRQQFRRPNEFTFDYVAMFIQNYKFSVLQIVDEDDTIEVEQRADDFLAFMYNIFGKYLGIAFNNMGEKSYEDQFDIVHMVYRYFLINLKHNFSCYVMNYINKHRSEITAQFPRKRDISSINFRRDFVSPEDIIIITNLYNIITLILDEDIDVDQFLNFSDLYEPRLETDEVIDHFNNFTITGNFYPEYRKMVTPDIKKEIEAKVRHKLLKSYKGMDREALRAEREAQGELDDTEDEKENDE